MKIKVYTKTIKKREIEEFIKLLPSRYRELDVKVEVYGSRLHLEISQLINGRKKSLLSLADFNPVENSIRVFTYMFIKDKYYKIRIFESLLHELRHKYQSIYFKEKFETEAANYINSGEGYSEQWIERDANKFARRTMNLYKNKINEIISFDEDWIIEKSN